MDIKVTETNKGQKSPLCCVITGNTIKIYIYMNKNSIKPSHCLTTHNKCKIEEKKKIFQSASGFFYIKKFPLMLYQFYICDHRHGSHT
jgi:hypothetical protein